MKEKIMGLEWKHVNLESGSINVEQSSQYIPGKGIFTKDTKNQSSRRVVAVPGSVLSLLKEYRTQQLEHRLKVGDLWNGSDQLFTTWDGKPAYPGWPSKWLKKFLEINQLPHTTFHSLRHLSATLMIKEGIPVKSISARLGHSTISTTMDIYGHALKSTDQEAADKMDEFINNYKKA